MSVAKNLGGCLLVIVAILGFYVAITLSFTFWACRSRRSCFSSLILFSLASDHRPAD
jgi:hypothetical protein